MARASAGLSFHKGVASSFSNGSRQLRNRPDFVQKSRIDILGQTTNSSFKMEQPKERTPQSEIEQVFQVPIWATLLFVITMLAVYFLGRGMIVYYDLAEPLL